MAGGDTALHRACFSPPATTSGATEAPAELRRMTRSGAAVIRHGGMRASACLVSALTWLLRSACTPGDAAPPAHDDPELLAASATRRSHTTDVPHVRQSYNWDCGLACVLMALGGLGAKRCDLRVMRRLCPTTSIWTVDLAHLLRRFGVDVTLCTITLGANPEFASESFYVDTMEEDGQRVERLFRDAAALGIPIQRRSIGLDELRRYVLTGQYLIIALVDKRKLTNQWSSRAELWCGLAGSGYTGHYVLVCGYDGSRGDFVVRDPASSRQTLYVPAASFEEARKSFGTDEDVLLITVRPLAAGAEAAVLAQLPP